MSLLPSVSERDIDATVQVSTNKVAAGSNQFAYLVLRRKDNGNQYQARLALCDQRGGVRAGDPHPKSVRSGASAPRSRSRA